VSNAVALLEEVARVTPLGFRFRDEQLGVLVGDGLAVTLRTGSAASPTLAATTSPSGVFAFHALPGLVARPLPPARPRLPIQFGAGDADYWRTLPPPVAFTVDVDDPWGRFLPLSFQASAPTRDLFVPACLSGASSGAPAADAIPLFSAPARSVAGPIAVVRVELWDPVASAPAAWAVVEAQLAGGPPCRGMADAEGRLALFLRYPPPDDPIHSVPASLVPGLGPPLTAQEWALELQAFYARPAAPTAAPDLCTALAQPPATLWADRGGGVPLGTLSVQFGRALLVRSRDTATPAGRVRITA
jgi:hypothetical protein